MNKIFLMGRLTKSPDIRYSGDTVIAKYSIAVDRRFKDANGEYQTDFFNLVSFGNTAKFVEKFLNKGTKILAEGEIRNNNYEKDGKKHYQDQIVINNVEFAESKNAQPTEGDNDGFNKIEGEELPFV